LVFENSQKSSSPRQSDILGNNKPYIDKVIEKIHLTRNSNAIAEQQNRLQKGFTQGEMPVPQRGSYA
jgi:hypothetical protein